MEPRKEWICSENKSSLAWMENESLPPLRLSLCSQFVHVQILIQKKRKVRKTERVRSWIIFHFTARTAIPWLELKVNLVVAKVNVYHVIRPLVSSSSLFFTLPSVSDREKSAATTTTKEQSVSSEVHTGSRIRKWVRESEEEQLTQVWESRFILHLQPSGRWKLDRPCVLLKHKQVARRTLNLATSSYDPTKLMLFFL